MFSLRLSKQCISTIYLKAQRSSYLPSCTKFNVSIRVENRNSGKNMATLSYFACILFYAYKEMFLPVAMEEL